MVRSRRPIQKRGSQRVPFPMVRDYHPNCVTRGAPQVPQAPLDERSPLRQSKCPNHQRPASRRVSLAKRLPYATSIRLVRLSFGKGTCPLVLPGATAGRDLRVTSDDVHDIGKRHRKRIQRSGPIGQAEATRPDAHWALRCAQERGSSVPWEEQQTPIQNQCGFTVPNFGCGRCDEGGQSTST